MYQRSFAFNERDLPFICNAFEITYAVIEDLAPSKKLRDEFHNTTQNQNAWPNFLHGYEKLLVHRNILRDDGPLTHVLRTSSRIALMCSEQHHLDCHRSVTALYLQKMIPEATVTHLEDPKALRDRLKRRSDTYLLNRGVSL
jgi:uncharacterized protein YeaO (DUF488 family)